MWWKVILAWFGTLFKDGIAMFVAYKSGVSSAKKDIELELLKDETRRLKEQREASAHIITVDDADGVWADREKADSD